MTPPTDNAQVKNRAWIVYPVAAVVATAAYYLLGHNIGGNTSGVMRETVYFRLHREGHRTRWHACVQDPLLEFEPVAHRTL